MASFISLVDLKLRDGLVITLHSFFIAANTPCPNINCGLAKPTHLHEVACHNLYRVYGCNGCNLKLVYLIDVINGGP